MKRIVIALAVAAVLAGGAVAGWNILDNTSTATVRGEGKDRMVPHAEVEKQAEDNFARPLVEDAPDAVECPRGLRPKMHDTVRCDATFGEKHKTMLISVVDVEGDEVSFDYGIEEKSKK